MTQRVELHEMEHQVPWMASGLEWHLRQCIQSGFGICPSPLNDNYGNQIWARDLALTATAFYAERHPSAVIGSLRRILAYQRDGGSIPYRVTREYGFFKIIPGLKWLARPAFLVIQGLLGNKEQPLYEGQGNGAEDTIPAAVLVAVALYHGSEKGREFVREVYPKLVKAIQNFADTKLDPDDQLAVVHRPNPDWTETVQRVGKLGYVNVLWAQALKCMAYLAYRLGELGDARAYLAQYRVVKKNLLATLYDADGHFFRAKAGEDRLDTGATVLGALFFLSAEECALVEGTLDERVRQNSGLQNFDPPYAPKEILWVVRIAGNGGYHNEFVWPWLTCVNIAVMTKIARRHPDKEVRDAAKVQAEAEIVRVNHLYTQCNGAPEAVEPKENRIAKRTPLYTPPQYFAPSCATFWAAYEEIVKLH